MEEPPAALVNHPGRPPEVRIASVTIEASVISPEWSAYDGVTTSATAALLGSE